MILGDFNADGSYVSNKDMKKIRIRTDKNFHWLIGDDVDTTASNRNDHTYDRSAKACCRHGCRNQTRLCD